MSNGLPGIGSIGSFDLGNVGGADGAGDALGGAAGAKPTGGFGDVLKGKLTELNESQKSAEVATQEITTGKAEDLAQTMMHVQQADIALQFATQVRNKAIEAYQEILRMQV